MKVIIKGREQKGWSKKFKCTGGGNGNGGCGALLLVEQADIFLTSSDHYDGSTDYYNTFECPECSVLTDIEGSLPFEVKFRRKPGTNSDPF